jgi:HPt (histidine-containing phosphotransfer) domain-containing protein
LQGREDLLKKLAVEFLAGLDELLERMRKGKNERDGPALAFVAHKLKGQAAVFDAHAAAAAAGRLEAAAWKDDWDAVEPAMAELDRLLPLLCAALRA